MIEGDPPRLSPAGRALLTAADKGKLRDALDAISRGAQRGSTKMFRWRDADGLKAQTAQQRAMFANMGGGRGSGGGSGGGAKPSGGTGGLWARNPATGKREPGQGLAKGAPPPPAGSPRSEGMTRRDVQQLARARQKQQRIANIDRQLRGDISAREHTSLRAERDRLQGEVRGHLAGVSPAAADRSNAILNSTPAPTVRGRGAAFREAADGVTSARVIRDRADRRVQETGAAVTRAEQRLAEVRAAGVRPGQQHYEKRDLADARREHTAARSDAAAAARQHAQAERTLRAEMQHPANRARAAEHEASAAWREAYRQPTTTRAQADAAADAARQRVLNAKPAAGRDKARASAARDRFNQHEARENAATRDLEKAEAHASERGITPAERRTRQAEAARLREARDKIRRESAEAQQSALRDIEASGYHYDRGRIVPNRRGASTTPRQGFNPAGYRGTKGYAMDDALKASRRHSAADLRHGTAAHASLKAAADHLRAAGFDDTEDDAMPALKALDYGTICDLVCDEVCEALADAEEGDDDAPQPLYVPRMHEDDEEGDDAPEVMVYPDVAIAELPDGRCVQIPYTLEGYTVTVSEPGDWTLVEPDWRDVGPYAPDEDDGERTVLLLAAKAVNYDQASSLVRDAWAQAHPPQANGPPSMWPQAVYDDAIVVSADGGLWRVPYQRAEDRIVFAGRDQWVSVRATYVTTDGGAEVKALPPADLEEPVEQAPLAAIKALDDWHLTVRGVIYGGRDLVGDAFTKATDLGFARDPVGMPVYYDHAQRGLKSQIGHVTAWRADDDGIDFEVELDRRHRYADMVMGLARKGALGGSSGALPHLVVRQQGELKRWVMGELSLTPTPIEPRSHANTRGATPAEAPAEAAPAADGGETAAALVGLYGDILTRRIARRYV